MPLCNDKSVDYLNSLGYNLIALPREGITPLHILVTDSDTEVASLYGYITDLLEEPLPLMPQVFENLQAATISGLQTNKLEFNFGISFLKVLISALGGKTAGIEAAFGDASSIEFEYENVLYDTVMPASASRFLRTATPYVDSDVLTHFAETKKAYVIIDVLKSNSFGVRAYEKNGKGISVNLSLLKDIIGIDSKLVLEENEDLKMSYRGENPLGFGFKACPIWIDVEGESLKFRLNPNTNQEVMFRGSEPDSEAADSADADLTPVLLAPKQLMTLD
ncbi:hypothetical protein ACQ4M4_26140 [Leptolyngbya sp. AN02str]|uniref:gasdermin n=1 Tax=Leptolyngbya sp. AN02str TaxID=3423363 RepID=UPI003D31B78F